MFQVPVMMQICRTMIAKQSSAVSIRMASF